MQPNNYKVIYAASGQFGTFRVVDTVYNGRPARMLFGKDQSPQSGMATDDHPELLFDYNQRFLEIIMSQSPGRALMIGGGVLMLPIAAYKLFPRLQIDVAEIDKLQIQLARDYFEMPDDPRLNAHIADGIDFVKSSQHTYDMIIVDAFDGSMVPLHLVNTAAATQYKKAMTKDGIVAINFISEYKLDEPSLAYDIIDSFSPIFRHTELYQSDPEYELGLDQNMLLVASNAKLSLEYLQSVNIKR